MQTRSIVAAVLLSAGTLVASQNTITARDALPAATDITAAQSSKVIEDEFNYISSVVEGAAYSSVAMELATGVSPSVLAALETFAADPTAPAFSSILSLLPPDAQSFYVSIEQQASAIAASDLSITSTGSASAAGSTMSTSAMTSKPTTASGATTSASTETSSSAQSTSATTSAAAATQNAASQPTAAIMAAGAAAAGILGFVALL